MRIANLNPRTWNLDIDAHINRFVPASPLHRLPRPISHFLGYRSEQRDDVGNVLASLYSFVGAFAGLAVVALVFGGTEGIRARHPPVLIASFGASAILEYNSIRSPLGQPRNAILGHTLSALVGVCIAKLFNASHDSGPESLWIPGALACGLASALMLLTNTVHPPGGASAVLAATEPRVVRLGWVFVGLVAWGSILLVVVGCVVNNFQRQFPVFWWTGVDVKGLREERREGGDIEERVDRRERRDIGEGERIVADSFKVRVPEGLSLNAEEVQVLEMLRERLKGEELLRQRSEGSSNEGTAAENEEKSRSSETSASLFAS
ncbi:HPP-domain-containing protein [Lojkania enalia]|uniref:HPP-domain-containing protein n=1 Tax=Lojkania enalia TaxID=147567 RepID=A0A9P4K084_9PLEO|nr:HPP-domain-containing protein [Didymosphaeria enalia]